MPRPKAEQAPELSEFEKQRAANIAERDALLKKISLEAQSTGLLSKGPPSKLSGQKSSTKKAPPKKVKKEKIESPVPRRTSSRLRGLTADSEVAKRKAEEEYEAVKQHAEAKRMRVSGDLNMGDIVVGGQKWDASTFLGDVRSPARPYERTFGEYEINKTENKDLKAMREKMSGLRLWEPWEPNRIKITPERIYSMMFHPTESKPLIFGGDKLGNLGIFDASQTHPSEIKAEDDDNDELDDPDPVITTIKPHSRTICGMYIHQSTPSKLYTASYDSSIRALDLEKSVATEAYAPTSTADEEPLSGVDMAPDDPHVLYFATLEGYVGRHDTRLPGKSNSSDKGSAKHDTDLWQLSEKKIGGFSLCPSQPHYIATASLDRTMKLWDLRKLSKKDPVPIGEHVSSLSVSHAAFNTDGVIATASYDNTLKIYDIGAKGMKSWKPNHSLSDSQMKPDAVVKHNNQTGRWVTILRPQWQAAPKSSIQRFCIGNMNRFVDIYTSKGEQLAQLGGEGLVTAVPAVAVFHSSMDWVAGGTASGKLCLWM